MTARRWIGPYLGFLLLCSANDAKARPAPPATPANAAGVVVESVEKGFAAHQAGIRPGDVLIQWQRAASPPANPEPATGDLDSPFDLDEVDVEQAPRGEITLLGRRQGELLQARLAPGDWKLETRPQLSQQELEAYQEAEALITNDEIVEGLSGWEEVASALGRDGQHMKASWLHLKVARTAAENREWELADRAFESARREAEASGAPAPPALVTDSMARSHQRRSELERAATGFRTALEMRRATAPATLGIAQSLNSLGNVAFFRGDLATAESYYLRARDMRQQLAPDSLAMAISLNNLGNVAFYRGDLAAAEDSYNQSLAIRDKLSPRGLEVLSSLGNLGNVAFQRGALAAAEEYYRRSLDGLEDLLPANLRIAAVLNNLGEVARYRYDLAASEEYHRRSLAIKETLSACDTGLGKVRGGEGLMGLTWAFQYAGARSVVASLWSVSDESTGELMQRFYAYLKQGQSKDTALRSAQLDLLHDSQFSHPFHWASFQLVGDWR